MGPVSWVRLAGQGRARWLKRRSGRGVRSFCTALTLMTPRRPRRAPRRFYQRRPTGRLTSSPRCPGCRGLCIVDDSWTGAAASRVLVRVGASAPFRLNVSSQIEGGPRACPTCKDRHSPRLGRSRTARSEVGCSIQGKNIRPNTPPVSSRMVARGGRILLPRGDVKFGVQGSPAPQPSGLLSSHVPR